MGKKSSWDGRDRAFDYLWDNFNNSYNSPPQDKGGSSAQRDRDFQRYLYTGEKSSGMGRFTDKMIGYDGKDKGWTGKLFDSGIPRDQWDYYAGKAGITNVNSKSDAKAIIDYYNKDERTAGKSKKGGGKTKTSDASGGYKPEPLGNESENLFSDEITRITEAFTKNIEDLRTDMAGLESSYEQRLADQAAANDLMIRQMNTQFSNDQKMMQYQNDVNKQNFDAQLQNMQSINNRRQPYNSMAIGFSPQSSSSSGVLGTSQVNRNSLTLRGLNV